ncbi:class D sortase [Hazenella coriacea]|uniref:Sortase A n=1 Tax=Hazenella coriacea TaxID=1179467 RepID=A0A4R3LB67_9BACL|nr:class D sortase [Hazenella coriacea]TCS96962.1 sortase A [Hazenella coriacea]
MKWDRIIAYLFVTAGIAYASYSGTQYLQKLQVVEEIPPSKVTTSEVQKTQQPVLPNESANSVVFSQDQRPKFGEHFADLIIPRLQAKIPVVEGTNEDELARGVGHFAGSVLPGEPDNSVLSGHRDTVFRRMGEMKVGDELHVETSQGTFIYEIKRMWVTDADDRTVIVPHDESVLTLTTCYPFSYIGPAPQRYIIQSSLKKRTTEPFSLNEQGG